MSKMTEYLDAAVGYDSNGLPASTSQFTFGFSPFQIAETEDVADVTTSETVCQSDAIVDIKIVDEIAKVTFDFSNDTSVFVEFAQELEGYLAQKDHVTQSLNGLMAELFVAERNEDNETVEELQMQIRAMSIPFMLPTIMPVCFGGTVHVGFTDDPKFIFFTSDKINQAPSKVTMIFDARALFCQDEVAIYTEDPDEEIRAQQEELWYLEEAKKIEEENYQSQFGYNNSLYEEDEIQTDRRLKGVRIK
jgi:hypothetical protein